MTVIDHSHLCFADGDEEESLLITALATTLDNVDEQHFGDTECTDATRRRGLLGSDDSVSIAFSVSLSTSLVDDAADGSDLASSISSSLSAAVSSGELTSNLAAAATASGSTSVIGSAAVTSASVSTSAPTPAPKRKRSDDSDEELLWIILGCCAVVITVGAALFIYSVVSKKGGAPATATNVPSSAQVELPSQMTPQQATSIKSVDDLVGTDVPAKHSITI